MSQPDAGSRHGQHLAHSAVDFWDQTRIVALRFGDEQLKRVVVDCMRNGGQTVLQLRTKLQGEEGDI